VRGKGSKLGGPAQRPSFFLSLSQANVVRANVTSRKRHSTIWNEHLCAQKRSASLTGPIWSWNNRPKSRQLANRL